MTISNRRVSCIDALSLSSDCSPWLDVIAPQLNGELAVILLGTREHGRRNPPEPSPTAGSFSAKNRIRLSDKRYPEKRGKLAALAVNGIMTRFAWQARWARALELWFFFNLFQSEPFSRNL